MNKLSQIAISATVGSLATLAITVSPLIAQNKTPTPTPHSHSPAGMVDHQKMMQDMAEMMEKCKSKMASHNQPSETPHNQHHPSNTNPSSDTNERSPNSNSKEI